MAKKNSRTLKLLLMKSKKNYKVIISDTAKADIKKNAQWYNKRQQGLGKHFTQSIKNCIKIIQLQPDSFQLRYKNIRMGIPEKFPYLIVYLIDTDSQTINIIAVFHSSQNPDKVKTEM